MKKPKGSHGFTLVELLVVVSIIGLLTGGLVVSIQYVKAKARDTRRITDISSIALALTLYHNDYNTYPVWIDGGYIDGETDPVSTSLEGTRIISEVPLDPLRRDSPDCGSLNGYYYYYQSVDGSDYYLSYCLETDSILGKDKGENYVVP